MNRSRTTRRGSSLIEMMAAISVGSILLSLSGGLILMLLRWDAGLAHRIVEQRAQGRLAEALHCDVRAAATLTSNDDAAHPDRSSITLDTPAGRCEYRCEQGRVVRTFGNETRNPSREEYRLAPSAEARFRRVDRDGTPFVRLVVVERRRATSRAPERTWEIETPLGADRQFLVDNQVGQP